MTSSTTGSSTRYCYCILPLLLLPLLLFGENEALRITRGASEHEHANGANGGDHWGPWGDCVDAERTRACAMGGNCTGYVTEPCICYDNPSCQERAKDNPCGSPYMRAHCRKFCGTCGGEGCQDDMRADCDLIMNSGLCRSGDSSFYCPRTCGYCADAVAAGGSNGEGTKMLIISDKKSSSGTKSSASPSGSLFPSLQNSFVGYNYPVGNPFSSGRDPGFTGNQIFDFLTLLPGGEYALHDEVTVTDQTDCDISMTTKIMTTYREYRDAKIDSVSRSSGFQWGPKGKLSAKVGPVGFETELQPSTAGMSNSQEDRNMKSYFSSGSSVLMHSEAACYKHMMSFNNNQPPPLKASFVKQLKVLESKHDQNEETKRIAYADFIDSYGTHFMYKALFGAKMVVESRFSKLHTSSTEVKQEAQCRSENFGLNFGIFSYSNNKETCTSKFSSSTSEDYFSEATTSIRTVGSVPIDKLTDWAGQTFTSPAVVMFALDLLPNLFTEDVLRKHGIDYLKLNSWFIPMYQHHCTKMNKELPEDRALDCEVKLGCGFSDNCTLDQVCVNDAALNPTCLSCVTMEGSHCLDSFQYEGMSLKGCTMQDSALHKPWCATAIHANGTMKEWGYCDMTKACSKSPCKTLVKSLVDTGFNESYKGNAVLSFPFNHEGRTWYGCRRWDDVDRYQNHSFVTFGESWGFCNDDCPADGGNSRAIVSKLNDKYTLLKDLTVEHDALQKTHDLVVKSCDGVNKNFSVLADAHSSALVNLASATEKYATASKDLGVMTGKFNAASKSLATITENQVVASRNLVAVTENRDALFEEYLEKILDNMMERNLHCLESDIDYGGHDITSTKGVLSPMACQKLCQKDDRCNFFSYSTFYNRTCYLKTSDQGRRAEPGHQSGLKNCRVCLEGGTNYFGNDITQSHNVQSPSVCQQLCQKNDKCQFYTYGIGHFVTLGIGGMGGSCYLKTSDQGRRSEAGFQSGLKNCKVCLEQGTDYWGSDLTHETAHSAGDCRRICQAHPECQFFTFHSAEHNCYLKTPTDLLRRADPSRQSGQRTC